MTLFQKTGLSTAALLIAIPVGAWAQLSVGDSVGTTEAEIRAKFEAAGYTIEEIETEDGEIEVEFMSEGQEFEAEIDTTTGKIVEIDAEDEDDDDDDDDDA